MVSCLYSPSSLFSSLLCILTLYVQLFSSSITLLLFCVINNVHDYANPNSFYLFLVLFSCPILPGFKQMSRSSFILLFKERKKTSPAIDDMWTIFKLNFKCTSTFVGKFSKKKTNKQLSFFMLMYATYELFSSSFSGVEFSASFRFKVCRKKSCFSFWSAGLVS